MHVPLEVTRHLRAKELDKERQDSMRAQALDRHLDASTALIAELRAELSAAREAVKNWKSLAYATTSLTLITCLGLAAFVAYQYFNR